MGPVRHFLVFVDVHDHPPLTPSTITSSQALLLHKFSILHLCISRKRKAKQPIVAVSEGRTSCNHNPYVEFVIQQEKNHLLSLPVIELRITWHVKNRERLPFNFPLNC